MPTRGSPTSPTTFTPEVLLTADASQFAVARFIGQAAVNEGGGSGEACQIARDLVAGCGVTRQGVPWLSRTPGIVQVLRDRQTAS